MIFCNNQCFRCKRVPLIPILRKGFTIKWIRNFMRRLRIFLIRLASQLQYCLSRMLTNLSARIREIEQRLHHLPSKLCLVFSIISTVRSCQLFLSLFKLALWLALMWIFYLRLKIKLSLMRLLKFPTLTEVATRLAKIKVTKNKITMKC
jgi:hypothetical protein